MNNGFVDSSAAKLTRRKLTCDPSSVFLGSKKHLTTSHHGNGVHALRAFAPCTSLNIWSRLFLIFALATACSEPQATEAPREELQRAESERSESESPREATEEQESSGSNTRDDENTEASDNGRENGQGALVLDEEEHREHTAEEDTASSAGEHEVDGEGEAPPRMQEAPQEGDTELLGPNDNEDNEEEQAGVENEGGSSANERDSAHHEADGDADANNEEDRQNSEDPPQDSEQPVLASSEEPEVIVELRQRLARFDGFLTNEPLPGTRLPQLFDFDVRDRATREAARIELQEALGDNEEAETEAEPAEEPLEAGEPDPESTPSEELVVEPSVEGGLSEAQQEVLETLQRDLAEYTLTFLSMDEAKQAELLETLDAHVSLEERTAAAQAAAAEAEAAARAAEEAQAAAQEAARRAENERERIIQEGRARVLSETANLADRLADGARLREGALQEEEARLENLTEVRHSLESGELEAEEAGVLYDQIVDILIESRRALREALSAQVSLTTEIELTSMQETALSREIRELDRARQDAEVVLRELDLERRFALARSLSEGNSLRLDLLPFLPTDHREALTGFGPEGREQLLREVSQLELTTRVRISEFRLEAPNYPSQLWALATAPNTRNWLLVLLLLSIATVFTWRSSESNLQKLRSYFQDNIDPQNWRTFGAPLWERFEVIARPLLLCIAALLAERIFVEMDASFLPHLLARLVMAWATYRLCVRLMTFELMQRVYHLDAQKRSDLEATVRRFGRFGLAGFLLLATAEGIVGQGTLYTYLSRAIFLAGWVLAFAMFLKWRGVTREIYIETNPKGRFVSALKEGSGPSRLAASLIAMGVVFFNAFREAVLGVIGKFALGRKLLAFVSESKLTVTGEDEAAVEEVALPPFEDPKPDEELDHYPNMDMVLARCESHRGLAVALVGEAGIGKTSWIGKLSRVLEDMEQSALNLEVPHGRVEREEFEAWIVEALGHDGDIESLTDELAESTDVVITLDRCENLFLRAIGGTGAFRGLTDLVARTQHRVVWVCAFSLHSWRYLGSATARQNMFEATIELPRWNDQQIKKLSMGQVRRASIRISFDHLLETPLTGRARLRALEKARDEYFRLLSHYSQGNPRVALHFWRRSLTPGRGRWFVETFARAAPQTLDDLHEESRFVLAAVAMHQNLSPVELAETLQITESTGAALLRFLETKSILERTDDRFEIAPFWFRAVTAHLRRHRLLYG